MAEMKPKNKMGRPTRPLTPLDKKSLPSASDMAKSKANARSAVVAGLPNRTGPPAYAPSTAELDYQRKRREAYGRGENPDLTVKQPANPPSNMEKMPMVKPDPAGYKPKPLISTKPAVSPPPMGPGSPRETMKRPKPVGMKNRNKTLLSEMAKKKLKIMKGG